MILICSMLLHQKIEYVGKVEQSETIKVEFIELRVKIFL